MNLSYTRITAILVTLSTLTFLQINRDLNTYSYGADCNYFYCCCRPHHVGPPIIEGPGTSGGCTCNHPISGSECNPKVVTSGGEECGGSGDEIAYHGVCLEDPDGDVNCLDDVAAPTDLKVYTCFYSCSFIDGFDDCERYIDCKCKLKKSSTFKEKQVKVCEGVSCPEEEPSA